MTAVVGSGTSWHFIPLTGLSELDARGMLLKRQRGDAPFSTTYPSLSFITHKRPRERQQVFYAVQTSNFSGAWVYTPPPLSCTAVPCFICCVSSPSPPSPPAKVSVICAQDDSSETSAVPVSPFPFIIAGPFSCLPPCK